ncbi:RseA family anti-sigma factor [Rhodoferax aquaticus]|uniref:Anti sigma-E protein RseA N-terminal domain-containing protein n=1 Tax=Rhodoferax aquaticus TaxID=2527691 RepID=A0A515ERY6_9BURK|nr:RseA family anti-sigma factor [Rhodoferax aquaticus]QDL55424.1 hypothetical protein EXZ61_15285 [Rhodoferax aquaticus]
MTDMTSSASHSDEYLSTLFDGQVEGLSGLGAAEELGSSPDLETTWISYQVLGQVMRGEPEDPIAAQSFLANFERRLAREAVVPIAAPLDTALREVSVRADAPPAVAVSNFKSRWKPMVAIIASVLSGALGLGLLQQTALVQVAEVSQPKAVIIEATNAPVEFVVDSTGPAVMIRDPALDALLAAHQLQGGHSALQMPSGFLRNATFERPAK